MMFQGTRQLSRQPNASHHVNKRNLIIIVDPMIPYSKEITEGVDVQGSFYTIIQTLKTLSIAALKQELIIFMKGTLMFLLSFSNLRGTPLTL